MSDLDTFRSEYLLKLGCDRLLGQGRQAQDLTARADRVWDLVELGRREQELDVCRRFLKRLEKSIFCFRGQHVCFVNNIDFASSLDG